MFPLTLEKNSNYQNLYIMDFYNISKDYSIQHLSNKLPQLIKNNFSQESYLTILDAPKVIPTAFTKNPNLENGIIINGKYLLADNFIIVTFAAYDVDTWDKQASRTYSCDVNDEECVEKAFLACITEDVIPLFCSYYDCLGECNGETKIDCLGQCAGNAINDCMGICNGKSKVDCKDECNGRALEDNCGECDYTIENDCENDCNGIWGGDAFINVCGECVEGNTGLNISHGMDCLGNCAGDSFVDCNGECNGLAFINDCNVCVGGNTGNIITLGFDCGGACFGDSFLDQCGVCNGDNSSCADCKGIPNGNAIADNCGNCDHSESNDCMQDCNGDWGGNAYLNTCFVCVEGNTGLQAKNGMDCDGVCWGNAKVDDCGICNGNNVCDKENIIDNNIIINKDVKTFFHQNSNSKVFFKNSSGRKNNSTKGQSTLNLYNIVDNLKDELYSVNIGDFQEIYESNSVLLKIPITYSINRNFMNNFKYARESNNQDNVIYKFPNSEIDISEDFEKYLSSMKYQLVPVLFFSDMNDNILFMMIDSWKGNYNFTFKDSENIIIKNKFKTLFSITPGESSLQFNFDKAPINNEYKFSLANDKYKELGYMFVKFFNEHSLESDIYHYIINNN